MKTGASTSFEHAALAAALTYRLSSPGHLLHGLLDWLPHVHRVYRLHLADGDMCLNVLVDGDCYVVHDETNRFKHAYITLLDTHDGHCSYVIAHSRREVSYHWDHGELTLQAQGDPALRCRVIDERRPAAG